jgi:hypothetical protein
MANPKLQWLLTDGVTVDASESFAPENGIPGDPVARRLYNDWDGSVGSVDSGDFLITAVSRSTGVGDYSADDELAASGWIEIRLTGSGGTGMVNQTTGWLKVGRGRFVRGRAILAQGYRTIEQRLVIPLGAGIVGKEYKLRIIEDARAFMLSYGHTEGGAQGLRMGLGDASWTEILSGFEVVEAAVPDNTVEIARGVEVFAGVHYAAMAETATFSNLDGDGDALTIGNSYLALGSRDGTGGPTVWTKSVQGASPLSEANLPDLPDGHREIAWVEVPFSAVITDAEIHMERKVYGGAALVGTGLSPALHPFECLIGNALVVVPYSIDLDLTDDDLNYVWLSPSGGIESNTTGLQPEDMSCLIYELTVASGVITDRIDCRPWLYPNPVEVRLDIHGALSGSPVGYGVLPTRSSAQLVPFVGITAAVGDRGGTSGLTKFDIEATDRNDTYVSIYTDTSPDDLRPQIAYNAADPVDRESFPQVLFFHGGTRFKLSVPTAPGTASNGGHVVLRLAAVSAA